MSGPPPEDLMKWSKPQLVKELRRLRAVQREHAEQVPPAHAGGKVVDVAGDPRARHGALIDARGAVLLDGVQVAMIETGGDDGRGAIVELSGRVNYSTERVTTAYLMSPDGVAAIASEIAGLMSRASEAGVPADMLFVAAFKLAFDARIEAMP